MRVGDCRCLTLDERIASEVRCVDVLDGRPVGSFKSAMGQTAGMCVAGSDDGRLLVSGGYHDLTFWDLAL